MEGPAYSEKVLALFDDPPHLGPPSGVTHEGFAENPARGAWVRIYLRAGDGSVAEAGFHARGCPHTIAAAACAVSGLHGRNLADLADFSGEYLPGTLGLPAEKLDIRILVEDAIRAAARGRR